MRPVPGPRVPRCLSVAGSDSGGGAGIQADLKTFAAFGCHGMSALAALTAQDTRTVHGVHEVPPEFLRLQIRTVAADLGVDAAKTGMLSSAPLVRAAAEELARLRRPLVVDPVMRAKAGARLLREDAEKALVQELVPLATVLTPNAPEAEALTGLRVRSAQDAKRAARRLADLGPRAVVVKGGHLRGAKAVDVLLWEGGVEVLEGPRLANPATHGTGCAFSAAIAAGLARGLEAPEAVRGAKAFVARAIEHGLALGKGVGPVNPTGALGLQEARLQCLREVTEGLRILEGAPEVASLVPESQSQLGMALPGARGPEDVAAVPGRIVRLGARVRASACPEFGASGHVARTLIVAQRFAPQLRAAMNVRFGPDVLRAAARLGWHVSRYDRRREPAAVKRREGSSTSWGAEEAFKAAERAPDAIGHDGDWGKEPMLVILGATATEVARRAVALARAL